LKKKLFYIKKTSVSNHSAFPYLRAMCGIAGYFSKQSAAGYETGLQNALKQLSKRGPDAQRVQLFGQVGLGHARLSIIDTSTNGTQPMADISGRYTIIFNGEIFNFRELRQQFLSDVQFTSGSDTEVLLYLYIKLGKDFLQHLNGFFAFAIFDKENNSLFIARDRMGIKPLLIFEDEEKILFASEMKALLAFGIPKKINYDSLSLYLQLNYLPVHTSMLQGVRKLTPGSYMIIEGNSCKEASYYSIPYNEDRIQKATPQGYEAAKKELHQLVEDAVNRRLVSDVPLGAFLSGGIDSSIIVSQAVKHIPKLNTFSIGYSDEPYFDETKYADIVAKHFNTNHTVFKLSTDDMYQHLFDILDYIDEPFADSSAIAVYILCQQTRKHVTVSLSGDGGDELFAGYNKHKAEYRARKKSLVNTLMKAGLPAFKILPKSRNGKATNFFRQLERYSEGLQLNERERYWRWCTFVDKGSALQLLKQERLVNDKAVTGIMEKVTDCIHENGSLNEMLLADTRMVLPNDMLTKVDLMSMANSLEVRVPLLDYTVIDFAFSLPFEYKLKDGETKSILKDTFRNELPQELFNRPKHGFEVPLLKWFRGGLNHLITGDLLKDEFIEEQGIFDVSVVRKLKEQLFSNNPGDVHARIWGLIVFQYWYKKYVL
jgi:asparagine synthase (glutamine-hydrolysing)